MLDETYGLDIENFNRQCVKNNDFSKKLLSYQRERLVIFFFKCIQIVIERL